MATLNIIPHHSVWRLHGPYRGATDLYMDRLFIDEKSAEQALAFEAHKGLTITEVKVHKVTKYQAGNRA